MSVPGTPAFADDHPAAMTRHRPRRVAKLLMIAAIGWAAMHFARQRVQGADEPPPLPTPEEVTLETNDGVKLVATFYPSTLKTKKNAVPVVLLHASKGSRGDFESLALALQQAGHAVIAPDLRGHGDSARATERSGELRAADYLAMVTEDLEAVKRFLIKKNNAGELNIEKLCVVGVEMGSVVAVDWAAHDWNWPVLATGKQGQDVKALVLVSPEWTFKGLRINEAVAQPNVRADLSVMIITGRGNGKLLAEAKRLYSALERYHPATEAAEKKSLWLKTPQTSMQSTRLLNEKSLAVDDTILKFIDLRLSKQHIPWSERRKPLD